MQSVHFVEIQELQFNQLRPGDEQMIGSAGKTRGKRLVRKNKIRLKKIPFIFFLEIDLYILLLELEIFQSN